MRINSILISRNLNSSYHLLHDQHINRSKFNVSVNSAATLNDDTGSLDDSGTGPDIDTDYNYNYHSGNFKASHFEFC